MATTHSLADLKRYHNEAMNFFASQLVLMKDAIPNVKDDKLAKASMLLMSCGQTGAAIVQLAREIDIYSSEVAMLSRSFMETIINFCYLSACDEKEYRAFILHPIYKHYHSLTEFTMDNAVDLTGEDVRERIENDYAAKKKKQEKLKESPIVQEALAMFSETKSYLHWTKKSLNERIDIIQEWGKLMDCFFTLSKIEYYSYASEVIHGSLYGCMTNIGVFDSNIGLFDPDSDNEKKTVELEKKLLKDISCILLHLGILIHESLTAISYSNEIEEVWNYSYKNRNQALNLLFHVLERKIGQIEKGKSKEEKLDSN